MQFFIAVKNNQYVEEPLPEIKNLDCLLLADTTRECVPQHLQSIMELGEGAQLSQGELIFLLTYIVALESGFAEVLDYDKNKNILHHHSSTSSYHSKNVLRLSRSNPSYSINEDRSCFSMQLCSITNLENTNSDDTTALLVGFVTGDLIIVTLSPAHSTGAKGFSVALSMGRYILSVQRKNNPLHHRLSKLDELSIMLRDKLFVPMRNQHLYRLDAGVYPSLQAMPPELYDNILKYLNVNQLKILANVSKSLYYLTKNNKRLLKK